MKNKKLLFLSLLFFTTLGFLSCVDEKDFDFNRLAQSSINPHIKLPKIISTEVSLSDFFSLDSIVDTMSNLELVVVNDASGDYLDIVLDVDTLFKPEISKIDKLEGSVFEMPKISIGDVAGSFFGEFNYPDVSEPMDTLTSVEIPPLEDDQIIDSATFKQGSLFIALSSNINHYSVLKIYCNELRSKATGKPFEENLNVSSAGQIGTRVINHEIDLSDYVVLVGEESRLNFLYRFVLEVNGEVKPEYDVSANLEFTDFDIDIIYGKVGGVDSEFEDMFDIDLFSDSTLAKIFSGGAFKLEQMYLSLNTSTNIGIPAVLKLSSIEALGETASENLLLNPEDSIIPINPAPSLGATGLTSRNIYLNTNALNLPPEKITFKGLLQLNPDKVPGFVTSDLSLALNAKLHIPFKAQINDLEYEIAMERLDLAGVEDYVNSAKLILDLTNNFPISVGASIYCLDSLGNTIGQVLDTDNPDNILVEGAVVDQNGSILSPSYSTTAILIDEDNFKLLKDAFNMKLVLKLNTSSYQDNKPFIRLHKDSKLSVSLSLDVKANITI
ncbi:MAG: hypothetical protein LBM25_00285 [Bacteroidales bacterium]|jgi:hypothetical protein|nr:hypothetical protein [Bacteroidales bacterium]